MVRYRPVFQKYGVPLQLGLGQYVKFFLTLTERGYITWTMVPRRPYKILAISAPTFRSQGDIYDASRSKIRRSTRGEKCPKTNLESQGVLCEAYTLIYVYIVYCKQMAHIKGVNVPLHSKTGL